MNYARFTRGYRWGLLLLATIGPLWLWSGVASAAAAQTITITPTSISPTIDPGATYKGSFQVINQGKDGYSLSIYSTPYRVTSEAYTPDFTPLPNAPKVSSWFTFSQTSAYINSDKTLTIHYTISVPAATQPGGYYAAAFAQTQPQTSSAGVALSERVGELFYIEVAGPVVHRGNLLSWESSFLQQPPLTATIRIQDSGSINFPATIHVAVKDILGQDKYDLSTTKELLPQTIRRVTIPWQGSPPIGLFRVQGTVRFLGHDDQLPTRWVLVLSPAVRLIIVAFAVVVVFIALGRVTYRRRLGKHRTKYRER